MKGICKKQTCIAIIVKDGRFWIGSNWVENEQLQCPRKDLPSGVGYEMCKNICNQPHHAEVDACINAGENAKDATLYLIGHTYCCDNCKKVMEEYGIKEIIIVNKQT